MNENKRYFYIISWNIRCYFFAGFPCRIQTCVPFYSLSSSFIRYLNMNHFIFIRHLDIYSRFFVPFFSQIRKKTPWTVQSHFENALLTYGKHSKNVKWIICRNMYHNNRLKLSARIPVVNFCSVTYFSFWKQFEGRFCDFGL